MSLQQKMRGPIDESECKGMSAKERGNESDGRSDGDVDSGANDKLIMAPIAAFAFVRMKENDNTNK